MTEQTIENLIREIGDKALAIAYLKAENDSLRQQAADLTAQLDEATKPKEVKEDGV